MRIKSIRNFGYKIADTFGQTVRDLAPLVLTGYVIFNLGSANGCFDSERAIEAAKRHDAENPIKTVASVEEKWYDNSALGYFSAMMGGAGYNPRVIRTVTFDDGSEASLDYRTAAWQPMRRSLAGKEFKPQPGEQYEVVPGDDEVWLQTPQLLVRKVE